jgi:hypothetical protein
MLLEQKVEMKQVEAPSTVFSGSYERNRVLVSILGCAQGPKQLIRETEMGNTQVEMKTMHWNYSPVDASRAIRQLRRNKRKNE